MYLNYLTEVLVIVIMALCLISSNQICNQIVPENENVKEKPSVMEKLGIKLRMPLPT